MKIVKIIGFLVLVVLGVGMVVYGEQDDSPGAQGLGVLMAVGGVVGVVKTAQKK